MSETIRDRVLRVISTSKRIPLGSVRPECAFEELGIDSLDRLDILFDLECEFEIDIDDDQAKTVKTVSEVVTAIERLVKIQGGALGKDLTCGASPSQA